MTDRELLEAAARAAGLTIHTRNQAGRDACGAGDVGLWISNSKTCWNPLTDDGDAMCLAVDLQMDVYVRVGWVEAVAPMGAAQKVRYGLDGPRQAARRAITCAAAAMPARWVLGAA